MPVARLGPGRVRPVGLQRDPVAGRVGRPLAADVRRRRDDGDPRHAALGEHPVGHVQPERGLAGGGRRGSEERLAGVVEDGGRGGLLPRAQWSARGPGRQGATRRGGARASERHRTRQASHGIGRTAPSSAEVVVRSMNRVSSSHPLLRPRLPVGVVGVPRLRRAALALRRPARMAPRDDRPDRERRRLRAPRLHARQPGRAATASSAWRGMPFATEPRERIHGTWPMCRVVVATRRLAPEREFAVFRALQFAQFTSTAFLEDAGALRDAIAWVPGIDADAIIAAAADPETERGVRSRPRRGPHGRRAARPSSRASRPTPTAACASRRRA